MTPCSRGLTLAAMLGVVGLAAACDAQPGPEHHRVVIRGMTFEPSTLEVAPGDTVTWINEDIVPHTVTGADDQFDSGELAADASFTWVVRAAGAAPYECRYHPVMTGALTVK